MQITRKQLSRIIKEEYLRSTPKTRPGHMMTEARANLLAEQVIEEGFFDVIKAGWAGLKAGVGEAAAKAFAPVAKAAGQVQAAAKTMADNLNKALGEIKEEAVKKAALAAQASLQESLKSAMQKGIADGIKNLVAAGMKEEAAKTAVAMMAQEAATSAGIQLKGG